MRWRGVAVTIGLFILVLLPMGLQTAWAGSDPDAALTMVGTPDSVQVGDTVTYTVTLTNPGPSFVGGGVLNGNWSAELSFVSEESTSQISHCVQTDLQISCIVTLFYPSESPALTLVLKAVSEGDGTNTATFLDQNDPNPDNNTATVTTTITPGPSPTPTPTPSPTTPSPEPSGGVQTGAGGTATRRGLFVPAMLAGLAIVLAGLGLVMNRRARAR
jgi:uncharacterized repeat protein (TIGR01451 family)